MLRFNVVDGELARQLAGHQRLRKRQPTRLRLNWANSDASRGRVGAQLGNLLLLDSSLDISFGTLLLGPLVGTTELILPSQETHGLRWHTEIGNDTLDIETCYLAFCVF